jgi:hypothetical protein
MTAEISAKDRANYDSNLDFVKNLFTLFKLKNIEEGINGVQSIWLNMRMAELQGVFSGLNFKVDVVNMGASGDIQTACLVLMYCQPDDMTQPYHWLTQERIDFLVNGMKEHLGWS